MADLAETCAASSTAVDRMLETYVFADPDLERLKKEALSLAAQHGGYPAARLLGSVDVFLTEVRQKIRNGARFEDVKKHLGEDVPVHRPHETDPQGVLDCRDLICERSYDAEAKRWSCRSIACKRRWA